MQEKAWKKVIESKNLVWMGRNEREGLGSQEDQDKSEFACRCRDPRVGNGVGGQGAE